MSGTRVLLDLMGGVALLLWGLHMVQSGILRAYGTGSPAVIPASESTTPSQAARRKKGRP